MVKGLNPITLIEALSMKKEFPQALIYAGGSDIMVVKKKANEMLFLHQLIELQIIEEREGYLEIGAGCTYHQLLQEESIPQLLKEVVREIASPAIRNTATMIGNICNASPAGDALPLLYVLDTLVVAASLDEKGKVRERAIPINAFILGIRKIDLREDEIVTKIKIPVEKIANPENMYYKKIGTRKSESIAKLSFVGVLQMEEDCVKDLRIAFGSVAVTVVRRKEMEVKYIGMKKEDFLKCIPEIMKEFEECLHPIDDQRSTAVYRKKVCLRLLEEFLSKRR